MKQHILRFACTTFLGAAIAGSALTGTAQAQTAGSLAPPIASPNTEASVLAERVNHRRSHHRRHYRPRGGGVYFDFGNGSFSLTVPQKRYQRHNRPRYGYPRVRGSGHVQWCYARYRSYRHWDNTFQPYHGHRKQCVSPYY
ncbi:MAG: BA14K family protein [Rhizobiaceae bacterium]